jgi:amino acid transporter
MKSWILGVTQAKWNYYLSIFFDGMTALVFLILGIVYSNDTWSVIALFAVGVLFFTFLEYAVHAWLFHKKGSLRVFIEGHAHHHKDPFSFDAMPFFMSAVIALVFVWLLHFLMPVSDAYAIVGGLTLGYFNYGIMHHIMHRREFKSPYWRYMQEFHFIHHKDPKNNNGVTTDFWDRVFNTYTHWSHDEVEKLNEHLKRVKS